MERSGNGEWGMSQLNLLEISVVPVTNGSRRTQGKERGKPLTSRMSGGIRWSILMGCSCGRQGWVSGVSSPAWPPQRPSQKPLAKEGSTPQSLPQPSRAPQGLQVSPLPPVSPPTPHPMTWKQLVVAHRGLGVAHQGLELVRGGTGKPLWKEETNGKYRALPRKLRHGTSNPLCRPHTDDNELTNVPHLSLLLPPPLPDSHRGLRALPGSRSLRPRSFLQGQCSKQATALQHQVEGKRSGISPNPKPAFTSLLWAPSHSTSFSCSFPVCPSSPQPPGFTQTSPIPPVQQDPGKASRSLPVWGHTHMLGWSLRPAQAPNQHRFPSVTQKTRKTNSVDRVFPFFEAFIS